jgi:hypothetical protein
VAFFNHAASFASTIAFIVPKSFQKPSLHNKLDERFFMIDQIDIPSDGFTFEGETYRVSCCFQIWERHPTETRPKRRSRNSCSDFEFVASTHPFDIAIRRVGANAGRIFDDPGNIYSKQSHHFIKAKIDKLALKKNLEQLDLEQTPSKYHVAQNPSLSATEICNLYCEQFE